MKIELTDDEFGDVLMALRERKQVVEQNLKTIKFKGAKELFKDEAERYRALIRKFMGNV